jgi:hypothetical protein
MRTYRTYPKFQKSEIAKTPIDIVIVNKKVAKLVIAELHRRYSRTFITQDNQDDLFVLISCTEKIYPAVRNGMAEFAFGLLRGIALGKEALE